MITLDMTKAADSMTAQDLMTFQIALRKRLGDDAHVGFGLWERGKWNQQDPRNVVSVGLYPDGIGGTEGATHIYVQTWPEAIAAADQWITNYKTTHRNDIVRRMALAIIELTDEHTRCDDAMLRRKKFSAGEIAEFHLAACARAGEMCGNAPFRVEFFGSETKATGD